MPATIVGSAKGRPMTALTNALPRKRSRTSTHATSVPATALTAATRIDRTSVSLSAATACGAVTASTNACRPPSVERATTAASGIRTMTDSHSVATPSASVPEPPGAAEESARRRADGRAEEAAPGLSASLGSGDPRRLLDLRDRTLVGIEELVVDLRPAAEVADREQALRRRELRLVLGEDALVDRPVAPVGEDLLRRRRQRVLHERLRLLQVPRLRADGDRVLDRDRLVRDHVVDLLALLLGGDRLVLVRDEDVAGAGREVVERLAAGLVLDDDVLGDELAQVGEPGGRDIAAAALRPVGGHDVPLRRAARERVRREDLDARLEQVVPRADVLRVALADDEADDRLRDEALRRRARPVLGDEPVLDEAVHVRRERERHDVGGEARLDRSALVARGAVGLAERHAVSGRRLLEAGDHLVVDDLRGRVRDERELGLRAAAARASARGAAAGGVGRAAARGQRQGGDGDECGERSERACLHGVWSSKIGKPGRDWRE